MDFVNIIIHRPGKVRELSRFSHMDNAYKGFATRFEKLKNAEGFTLIFEDKILNCVWRVEKTVHGFVFQLKTLRYPLYYGFLYFEDGLWTYKNGNSQNLLHWRITQEDYGDSLKTGALPERFFLSQDNAAKLVGQLCINHYLEFHPDYWENTFCIFSPPFHPLPVQEVEDEIRETGYIISTHGLGSHREDQSYDTLSEGLTVLLDLLKSEDNKGCSFSCSLKDRSNAVCYTVEQVYSYQRLENDFVFWINLEKSRNGFFDSEAPWIFKKGCDNTVRLWHGTGDNQVLAGRFFHSWNTVKQLLDTVLVDGFLSYDPDSWENAWCCTMGNEEPVSSIADQLYGEKAMAIMEKVSGKTIRHVDTEIYDDPDRSDTDYWITDYTDYFLNDWTSDKHLAYEVGLQYNAMGYRYVIEPTSESAFAIMEKCFHEIENLNSDFFRIRVKNMAQEIAWKIEKLRGHYLVILFVDRYEELFLGLDNGYWVYKDLQKSKTAEIAIKGHHIPLKYLHSHTEIWPLVQKITQGKGLPFQYDYWDYMDEKPPYTPYDDLL